MKFDMLIIYEIWHVVKINYNKMTAGLHLTDIVVQ